MEHPAPPTRHTAEVSWPDVSGLVPHIMALDGLTYLREVRDGRLPGMAHGGFLSTLLDSATGLALHTTLPAGVTPPHIQVAYGFLEAARTGVLLRCEGRVQRAGKRVGHVRAEIHDAGGRLLCTGASTHAVVAHDFWQR